ncbi:MAG: hypothetical protein L0271_09500 [Gemmatimonadetes bacterium]|nr:hypothetical protein [Gemmatimonadota bacterium]
MRSHHHITTCRTALALCALALASSLIACASTTPIGELLAEPGRYDGRTVQVEGRVTRSAGVLGIGAYEIDDGTGSIVVIARGQGVPAEGANTHASGTFQSVFSWMGRTIAAIVQSDRTRSD